MKKKKRAMKQTSAAIALFMSVQMGVPATLVFADDATSAVTSNISSTAAAALASYTKDFNDNNVSSWKVVKGSATLTADNGALKAETVASTVLVDTDSPSIKNGEYEIKMKFKDVPSRIGLLIRYVDANNYALIHYDNNDWGWDFLKNGTETYGGIETVSNPVFEANKQYTFKVKYIDDSVQLWLDGQEVLNTTLSDIPMAPGKIGIRSWFANKTIHIDDIKLVEKESGNANTRPITITDMIASNQVTAEIDKEFPRVKQYTWKANGAVIQGQINGANEVKINGVSSFPIATSYTKHAATSTKGESAIYTLSFPDQNVEMDVELEVKDNMLNFRVTRIAENGTTKVQTIEFPNHDLVSVLSSEPAAQETAVQVTSQWNTINEESKDLKGNAADGGGSRTYAFLSNNVLAATIVNNVINGDDKLRVKVATGTDSVKKASLWNGAWTYRGSVAPGFGPEELPWSKVILTPDANNDSVLDWQDGAIAYRANAPAPYRSDMIRDNISYIAINLGSTTTNPFMRAFDDAKKISNLTDGFGQIVLHKGYQAEGHDDSHPDYGGHIGIRQGGAKDFNYILEEGKKYNIKGGVHINATEYILDAKETKMENMIQPLSRGWGWLDQAYYVDKTKDIESGELKRRLDMLKADTGDNLDFLYVDVYTGLGWNAAQLAKYAKDNGWMLGTEFAGPFNEQVSWVHWGTDPGYPNQGNTSKIMRFLRNDTMDGFLSDPLLKGNKQVGVGYWQNNPAFYDYKKTTEAFFEHNLPTKYMQYFQIIKMANDRVDFTNNVSVGRQQDGKVHLTKDGKDIAIMTYSSEISDSTIFIPWDPEKEDKIYHWNPVGGATTWDLPNSWSELNNVKLYKLSDLGREFVADVPVVNGKVTITAYKKIGYVVYKSEAPAALDMNWGGNGAAKDVGFDSQGFTKWQKSSTGGNTDHITIVKDGNADDKLQVAGPNDASVKQVLTGLTPGKTYSASVWVKVNGERRTTISVKQGEQENSNYLDNTNVKFWAQQHKYLNTNFERLRVNFDAVGTTATLALNVDPGASIVQFDDVRVWENPTKTDEHDGGAFYYEDFENVDEGYGPFVYSKNSPVRTHLVEKLDGQIKSYVIDGKTSLKTNEESTGEVLRTLPQTLRLQPDKKYHLTMAYNTEVKDMYTISVRGNVGGTVKDLASQKLDAGKGTLDLRIDTANAKDLYLAINKNFTSNIGTELTGTMVIDTIRVVDETTQTAVTGVKVDKADATLTVGQTVELNATVEPSNATNKNVTWSSSDESVATVSVTNGKAIVTAKKLGTADITVTTEDGKFKAVSKITVSATAAPSGSIIAPTSAYSGKELKIQVGMNSVTQGVYAQDLSVEFDPTTLEYMGANSLITGVSIVDKKTTPDGKLRFIVASEGSGNAVTGTKDVLELTFKAKQVAEAAVNSVIAITKAIISDAAGTEVTIGNASATVQVSKEQPQVATGDLNGDGKVTIGDLAIAAANYGATKTSPNWSKVQLADFDNNGVIEISDLAAIAQKLIN